MQKSSIEVRALVPQLLQSLGNVASALGSPGIEGMTRHLERFELTGMRLQQDVEALAGGIGDATVIARRLADGNDYMGQVVGGLGGEDSGLGLPKVTGPEAEGRFKSTSSLYAQLSEKVRTAITSADRVKSARDASAALAASGDKIYTAFATRVGVPGGAAASVVNSRAMPIALLAVGLDLADHPVDAVCDERQHPQIAGNAGSARTSATRKRFCGCSTSCRAWPTVT